MHAMMRLARPDGLGTHTGWAVWVRLNGSAAAARAMRAGGRRVVLCSTEGYLRADERGTRGSLTLSEIAAKIDNAKSTSATRIIQSNQSTYLQCRRTAD